MGSRLNLIGVTSKHFDNFAFHLWLARAAAPSSPRGESLPDDAAATAAPDNGAQYDLLVVYTPAARAAAGGAQAIDSLAALAVEDTNRIYQRSGITIRARLVHTEEIDYAESGSVLTDVTRLRRAGDGFMDGVHALRDAYAADLVSLWVSHAEDFGGYGVFNLATAPDGSTVLDPAWGFTALVYSQASPNLLAHEIGHNFSCAHDKENTSGLIFYPYAYGWRFTGQDHALYRTVMAYAPGAIIPYFSSPLLRYQGTPTGVADVADNARALNANVSMVANFRASATANPTAGFPFFDGNVSVGSGFYYLGFFGYYAPYQFPYLYHSELGYLYAIDAANGSAAGAYFYDFAGLGFLYSSPQLYPYFYAFDQSAFLFYFKGTSHPRVFVNLATGQFIYK